MMELRSLPDDVLREALDAAPDGIAVVDERGAIVFVNRMFEEIFEFSQRELIGMCVDNLLPESVAASHAGRRADYATQPRTRAMGTGLDLHGRRKSGSQFPV